MAPSPPAVRCFGLIGHPVGHSLSPVMMRAAFAALGLPCEYDALDVPSGEALARVEAALRTGERAGLNVTVPHKRAACALADELGESARRAGAANVLVPVSEGRIRAENTDAEAIVRVLEPKLAGRRRALVIGSGGAARAALVACDVLGFQAVQITSRSWRTPEDAAKKGAELPELRAEVQPEPWLREQGEPTLLPEREVDVVIQATSAGMHGADPGDAVAARVPWQKLGPETVAFDVVYRPRLTPFLAAAGRHGLVIEGGLGMLVEQAALSLKMWLGVEAPREVMRRAAEAALGA